MPGSYRGLDAVIAQRIRAAFPRRDTRVLDVGAGKGKYRHMLWDYSRVDAIEAHPPYVTRFALMERYRNVFILDVREVTDLFCVYDLVILGDVLEHLSIPDATEVLRRIEHYGADVLVVIPFMYEQGPVNGVEWERHLQPDLTHELFNERYPGFTCLVRDDVVGAYGRPEAIWSKGG